MSNEEIVARIHEIPSDLVECTTRRLTCDERKEALDNLSRWHSKLKAELHRKRVLQDQEERRQAGERLRVTRFTIDMRVESIENALVVHSEVKI
jgi:hypothetical protein